MLHIVLERDEVYNERLQEFQLRASETLTFEHSLVSLSKWESFWELPFINTEKTTEQTRWYIKAMCLDEAVTDETLARLKVEDVQTLQAYIESKMTATWFAEDPNRVRKNEVITAEVIYYMMIGLSIPFECQHWHLNRLLTLIQVCSEKNAPKKKMSRRDIAQKNRDLNAQRLAQYNTSG